VLLTELTVAPDAFTARTGWTIKPEGACKGDVCVPLPPDAVLDGATGAGDRRLAVEPLAEHLGMPLVRHAGADLWALGPETAITGRALTTAAAPDFTLPDVNGNAFTLSSLRGQKVVMVAWASW
jgi:hypothetical protein